MTTPTPRIPPNEPQTEAGQALLSRLPRYGGVDVLATILAIEREAQAIPPVERCHCGHLNASCDRPDRLASESSTAEGAE